MQTLKRVEFGDVVILFWSNLVEVYAYRGTRKVWSGSHKDFGLKVWQ